MYFRQNNVLRKNDHGLKKYQLQEIFIFQQLIVKIADFAILDEITGYYSKEENVDFKTMKGQKS